jgi:hypothetical protein
MGRVYTVAAEQRLADAITLFQSRPGFAATQLSLDDKTDELERLAGPGCGCCGSRECAAAAAKWFENWMETMVGLIWDMKTQIGFIALVDHAERETWRWYTGFFPEFMPPGGPHAGWLSDQIDRIKKAFFRRSYKQVVAHEKGGRANAAGASMIAETRAIAASSVHNRMPANRYRVEDFIKRVAEAGYEIARKVFWQAGGYTNATEFERWQSGSPGVRSPRRKISSAC